MFRVLLAALALALVAAAPASAQDQQANLDRAAAYWGASPDCPGGVHVTYDQALVTDDAFAAGGGCGIWTGDRFAAESPGGQCQTIVHEWGHLLGYGEDHAWHPGLPADPVGVMTSYAMPPACADLAPSPTEAPATVAAATPGPAASAPPTTHPVKSWNLVRLTSSCRSQGGTAVVRRGGRTRCVDLGQLNVKPMRVTCHVFEDVIYPNDPTAPVIVVASSKTCRTEGRSARRRGLPG